MSWTELRKQLAQRAGATEKEAGAFWSAFNSQLVEALKQDKQLKINGLGTFKLQAVAPRKSVNVKTGEAMTIEGYNKIVFAPEASVKELVESKGERLKGNGERVTGHGKPKAEPEIDPLKKLGEQANEIVDILGELGQAPKEEKKKGKRVTGDGKRKAKKPVEPVVEEPKVAVETPEPVVEEPKPVEEPVIEPVVAVVPDVPEVKPEEPEEPKKQEKPKKKYHFLRDTLICVVCLLLILLIGFFFLRSQLSTWIESFIHPSQEQTELVAEAPATVESSVVSEQPAEVSEQPAEVSSQPSVVSDQKAEPAQPKPVQAETWAEGYEILTVEEMHQDSRLTWMAKRYYGAKIYWVYIYDANKDKIANPCKINVGTPVRVPKLTKAQLDTTRTDTRERLERLTIEAEAACWAN